MSILIVEDDLHIRELLARGLSLSGHQIHVAANGQEALDLLARVSSPALILLDLLMPIMDGWKFVEEMGLRYPDCGIPIVVFSALEADARALQGIRKCIRKPVPFNELLSTVEEYCRHA